ncbi:MAG: hypothetical protein LBJ10_06830, partial [Clostridiales bacterium]|nr:hypothetical protein [Clostridiales bacterium]
MGKGIGDHMGDGTGNGAGGGNKGNCNGAGYGNGRCGGNGNGADRAALGSADWHGHDWGRFARERGEALRPYTQFTAGDRRLQRIFESAAQKLRGNLRDFGGRTVLVEGGGYDKIWLETQPMGGEMYARFNMEAALNNQLLFMEHQRADGRMPGSIRLGATGAGGTGGTGGTPGAGGGADADPQRAPGGQEAGQGAGRGAGRGSGSVFPEFNKFQGFCFPWPALNMYYISGAGEGYLRLLQYALARFDAYLWAWRDSDGDGCLESWCVTDTGEDGAL